jgi:hypothetical protein
MHSDSESGSLRGSSMFEKTCITDCSSRGLNIARLNDLKYKAIRSGLWFKALRRIDRVLVNVTVKIAKSIHSATLARALFSIMEKLESAFKSGVWNVVHRIGFPLAQKLGVLAQKWGNHYARNWAFDESFAKFLAIMHMNSVGALKI